MPRNTPTASDAAVMVSLYNEGYTVREISNQTAFGYGTVYRHLHKNNIKMRNPGKRSFPSPLARK